MEKMRVKFFASLLTVYYLTFSVYLIGQENLGFYDYDVTHYQLSIEFNLKQKSLTGSVEIIANIIHATNEIIIHASNKTLVIDSIILSQKKLSFTHNNDILNVYLSSILNPSSSINLKIFYHGTSDFKGNFEEGGVFFSADDKFATSSEPNFARKWFPCKDIPSDKATASISITVPDNLIAVSNGNLIRTDHKNGTTTYNWETKYQIATYLISIAAAPYSIFMEDYQSVSGKQLKLYYYVFPEDSIKAQTDFTNTKQILSFFEQIFGEYPFVDEKFGFVEVMGDMTMENQTIPSIQQNMFTGDRQYELTLAHETAHQWLGNMMTPLNWKHTWLNEGFATYAEALYLEHRKGSEVYQKYINSMMSMPEGTYSGSVIGQSDTSFWDSFSPRQYYKGAIILHMLRKMLGDSSFFKCLKTYTSEPQLRYSNVQTEDFVKLCEDIYGHNLEWFFKQWVYANTDSFDRPTLIYDWKYYLIDNSYNIELIIEQKNNYPIYRLPLDVDIATSQSQTKFNIIDSLKYQRFNFSLKSEPQSLIIDREGKIFKTLEKRQK